MQRGSITFVAITVTCVIAGCKSAPAPTPVPAQILSTAQYPVRPNIAPPTFKVFHHDASSITLVTQENETDAEIESLVWELRDVAHTHNFEKLGISQKWIDARDPMMWFHIYRGMRCASEKYAGGKLPCGDSYHAAGEYTLGGFTNRDRDDGVLLRGDDRQTQLWNPDTTDNSQKQDAEKQGAKQ